eukprot:g419.t1
MIREKDTVRIVCPKCEQLAPVSVVLAQDCCALAAHARPGKRKAKAKTTQLGEDEHDTAAERRRRRQLQREKETLRMSVFFPRVPERRYDLRRLHEMAAPTVKTAKVQQGGKVDPEGVPAPGTYDLPSGLQVEEYVGRFSSSKPKTDIERQVLRAALLPSPASYSLPSLGDGTSGGRFSLARPKSELDWRLLEASASPGPGEHRLPDPLGQLPGGRWNATGRSADPDGSLRRAAQLPGPADSGVSVRFGQGSPVRGGKFSDAHALSELDFKLREARMLPGPGRYSPA